VQTTNFQRFARWMVAAVCLGAMVSSATAGSFTRGCAARDLQVLMMIENRQSAGTASSAQLKDAILTMMHARIVCHEGFVLDALAIYDSVAQSITVDPALSPWPQTMKIP
jgi:hypothetical protein